MAAAPNPFIEYRQHLDTYQDAVAAGLDDHVYLQVVTDLDEALIASGSAGFRLTPVVGLDLAPVGDAVPADLGPVLAKVETGNVGGSHKARHLFGLVLQRTLARQVGSDRLDQQWGIDRRSEGRWGIASCGNAALAAAVLAHSVEHPLDVYVPADADPQVLARLAQLEANVIECHRLPGQSGDPCVAALEAAQAVGTVPFTVQGTTCPGVFDGARTIGLEFADQVAALAPTGRIDHLYIQVGGGAFAVAVMDGWTRAVGPENVPRLHPVQAERAHPLVAAWHRLEPDLQAAAGVTGAVARVTDAGAGVPGESDGSRRSRAAAEQLRPAAQAGALDDIILGSSAMEPWPEVPHSVASGILDDVTYDWRPLLVHLVRSGGWPVLASEQELARAAELAAGQVSPPPDATGAAGLAGVLADPPRDASAVGVILSGVDRTWEAARRVQEASGRPNRADRSVQDSR